MTGRGGVALYTPAILALAVELGDHPLTAALPLRGEAHSRVCGSRVVLGLATDRAGLIRDVGARVTACAIGQSAAALFLRAAAGKSAGEIADALGELEAWLASGEPLPAWPDLALLAPARAHPARHAAILLPWKAALAALSNTTHGD